MSVLKQSLILVISIFILFTSNQLSAANFDWMAQLNLSADSDNNNFRVRLARRFDIGELQIGAVLDSVRNPADAYMVLRLGEMSRQPMDRVMQTYRNSNQKGWGRMAMDLGIKPGSAEFKALKRGHDLNSYSHSKSQSKHSKGKNKEKHKAKGKMKDKGKNKGKGKHKEPR